MVSEPLDACLRRLNAEGRPFRKGDVREDGFIFRAYVKSKITKEGFYKESWLSPAAYERYQEASKKAINDCNAKKAKERRALLNEIKLAKGCQECGYNKHPAALDFDHINDDKEFTIGTSYASVSLERLLAEVNKCQILCANCHRIKSCQDIQRKRIEKEEDDKVRLG